MIFTIPALHTELEVVALIDDLQQRLRFRVAEPRRWAGSLRRLSFARAVQGSNSIEGYNASLDDVAAAVAGEEPLDADDATRRALEGYRDALTYVLQLAREPEVAVDESLLKALHFMMIKHDLRKNPGRWRPGAVFVRRDEDGQIVYEGPEAELVPTLVAELLDQLRSERGPVVVRAAMAHLNLVIIHPFSDGNGRMARCLQTLVLTRDHILSPEFNSIEEYLGRNTQAYYDILAEVGRGSWRPTADARPWIRFCLTAHYRQARTILRRVQESEELWDEIAELVRARGAPARSVGPLFDAALGLRIRNSSYRSAVLSSEGEEVSEQTASRDLRVLVGAGLLMATGERRGRIYSAATELRSTWSAIRARRPPRADDDPFLIVSSRARPELPLG